MPLIRKQKGIGLFELLLSLLIITSLIFMSMRYYQNARQNVKIDQALLFIHQVADASYRWLEGSYNFVKPSPISLEALIAKHYLPAHVANSKFHPWHGKVLVGPGSDPTTFQLILTQVPEKSCLQLRQKLSDKLRSSFCSAQGFVALFE